MKSLRSWGRGIAGWYREWSPWLAGVLLLFNVGLFSGILFADASAFLSNATTIGWVSAIATASATVVALLIAQNGSRRSHEKEALVGRIAVVKFSATLFRLEKTLGVVGIMLKQDLDESELVRQQFLDAKEILAGIDHTTIYSASASLAAHLVELHTQLELAAYRCTDETDLDALRKGLNLLHDDMTTLLERAKWITDEMYYEMIGEPVWAKERAEAQFDGRMREFRH